MNKTTYFLLTFTTFGWAILSFSKPTIAQTPTINEGASNEFFERANTQAKPTLTIGQYLEMGDDNRPSDFEIGEDDSNSNSNSDRLDSEEIEDNEQLDRPSEETEDEQLNPNNDRPTPEGLNSEDIEEDERLETEAETFK